MPSARGGGRVFDRCLEYPALASRIDTPSKKHIHGLKQLLPQQQHLPELLAPYLPVLLAQYLPWQQRLPELLAPRLSQRQRLPVLLLLVPLGKFGKQIYLRRTQYP